jgi:hypothetical protein
MQPLEQIKVEIKHKDKPWHDIDCKSKLRHIKSLGRLLGNYPWDKSLRLKSCMRKKQYNKLVRKKHRIFKSKLLQNLIESSDNNPRVLDNCKFIKRKKM